MHSRGCTKAEEGKGTPPSSFCFRPTFPSAPKYEGSQLSLHEASCFRRSLLLPRHAAPPLAFLSMANTLQLGGVVFFFFVSLLWLEISFFSALALSLLSFFITYAAISPVFFLQHSFADHQPSNSSLTLSPQFLISFRIPCTVLTGGRRYMVQLPCQP